MLAATCIEHGGELYLPMAAAASCCVIKFVVCLARIIHVTYACTTGIAGFA
jgi:hypothetical protein